MIGDEESGGRECARIARPLSHQLLNLHPFSGRGGAKRRSAVGRWTGVVFRCLRSRGFERAEGFTYHDLQAAAEKWPAQPNVMHKIRDNPAQFRLDQNSFRIVQ